MKAYESKVMKNLVSEVLDEAQNYGWFKALNHLQRRMNDIPEIDVKLIEFGEWIKKEDKLEDRYYYECSLCGEESDYMSSYCPCCGAVMRRGG